MSLVARLDWYRFYSKRTCTAVCGSISAVGVGAGARGCSARAGIGGRCSRVFSKVGGVGASVLECRAGV